MTSETTRGSRGSDDSRHPVLWIDREQDLAALASELADAGVVALDTEQDAFFAYRPKICVLQLAAKGREYVVDCMALPDLSLLRAPLADRALVKIFHAADNDIALLRRDFGVTIQGLFDTMSAASILGYPRTGLAALIEEHFGVTLDKKYQRSDWRRRPLEAAQIDYAALDVRYLDRLREILLADLDRLGRVEEAASDFERIERAAHDLRQVDPNDYYRMQGARTLDGTGRRILRDLFVYRDGIAREEDRAAYRVCSDATLFEIAKRRPTDRAGVGKIHGVSDRLFARGSQAIVDLVAAATAAGDLSPPPPPPREHAPLDESERALFDALRDWRRKRAEQRKVEPGRVVPNALLLNAVRQRAGDEAGLARAGFEPWRIREYGAEILATVQRRSGGDDER